ncbi:MAG: hypothetical protein GX549_03630 [Clostridiales bacterium]|nr:hypothetical protein [Clostridiales bacterium]
MAGVILLSYFVYAGVFRLYFVISSLGSWVVVTLINWKKETATDRPKVRWFTVFLIALAVALSVAMKPAITYGEGKRIAARQGYENISELRVRSMRSFGLKTSRFVRDAYLYTGEKDNARYYILLSPIDGQIETEKIGDGNYLDMYFESYILNP